MCDTGSLCVVLLLEETVSFEQTEFVSLDDWWWWCWWWW